MLVVMKIGYRLFPNLKLFLIMLTVCLYHPKIIICLNEIYGVNWGFHVQIRQGS